MVNNSCVLNISIKNMQWQKKKKAGCSPQMPVPGHYSHFYIRQPCYITDKYNRKKPTCIFLLVPAGFNSGDTSGGILLQRCTGCWAIVLVALDDKVSDGSKINSSRERVVNIAL